MASDSAFLLLGLLKTMFLIPSCCRVLVSLGSDSDPAGPADPGLQKPAERGAHGLSSFVHTDSSGYLLVWPSREEGSQAFRGSWRQQAGGGRGEAENTRVSLLSLAWREVAPSACGPLCGYQVP